MDTLTYIEIVAVTVVTVAVILRVRKRRAKLRPLPAIPLDPDPLPTIRPQINRRFWWCLGVALALHLTLVVPALIELRGCSSPHDRPLGILGGSGDQIAKGTPDGVLGGKGKEGADGKTQAVIQARAIREVSPQPRRRAERAQPYMTRISHDSLLRMLKSREGELDGAGGDTQSQLDSVGSGGTGEAGPLGLPQGTGTGMTAAGSPWGDRIGAKLYLYRLKYPQGDWAANDKALPTLLREVHLVLNVPVSNKQETLVLSDLVHHRGNFIPSMLFITGTGRIPVSDADRAALRDYLQGGGMLVADSSGGTFELHFEQLMREVLPGRRMRVIEHDHEVYRGGRSYDGRVVTMPYKLSRGCPIYRDHGSRDARGIFADDGRLMVFFSPGDLGSAWNVVDLGQKRGAVEQAFQMGTNLVAYSLMHVRDLRK